MTGLERASVTRYVTPLREGGSLPGIVEADDLGTYVCKFRGAGQGIRVLAAEVIVGELARRVGLRTPRLVALDLDVQIARYEADEEVQDLINASGGVNLGVDFLPGAFGYDPPRVRATGETAEIAARVLWLDAFCANVDRSWRNPNLLIWHGDLWLIDHGAALYFHHGWGTDEAGAAKIGDPLRFARQPWKLGDHILADYRDGLAGADEHISTLFDEMALREIVAMVPDEWLVADSTAVDRAREAARVRAAYVAFLGARLETRQWLPGASDVRSEGGGRST